MSDFLRVTVAVAIAVLLAALGVVLLGCAAEEIWFPQVAHSGEPAMPSLPRRAMIAAAWTLAGVLSSGASVWLAVRAWRTR